MSYNGLPTIIDPSAAVPPSAPPPPFAAADMAKMRRVPQEFVDDLKTHREQMSALRKPDPRLSLFAVQEKVAQTKAATLVILQSTFATANVIKSRIEKDIAAALNPEPSDSNEAVLQELRNARTWSRLKGLLNSGLGYQAVIQIAVEAGDVDSFRVLREELPLYLTAANASQQDRVIDEIVRAAMASLDQQEEPLLTPVQRSARAAAKELEIGFSNLTAARAMAEREVETGTPVYVMPGWGRGQGISTT